LLNYKKRRNIKKVPSTQSYLNIEEIHDGVVILKNGGMRTVLMVSTVNFALKSEDEQNATIYSYQNFINSLSFPIQILMQSRRLDLSIYLSKLRIIQEKLENQLLRLQTKSYIDFMERLLSVANIMDKKFYIVIPYEPIGAKKISLLEKIHSAITGRPSKRQILEFENNKKELDERARIIAQGLGGIGLRAVQLNTLELTELYYGSYNPDSSSRQKIASISQFALPSSPDEQSEKRSNNA